MPAADFEPRQLVHIFRDATGHVPDTPENRRLLREVASDEGCFTRTDRYGNRWYTRLEPDGTQVWVQVRHRLIVNGGINLVPRDVPYNDQRPASMR